jgi:hypothetical protein
LFHTDGYIPVALSQRGQVDTFAASQHVTGDLTLERLFSDRGRIFLRGSPFGETRKNGTPSQNNRTTTTIREVDRGGDWRSKRAGAFSLVAYTGRKEVPNMNRLEGWGSGVEIPYTKPPRSDVASPSFIPSTCCRWTLRYAPPG